MNRRELLRTYLGKRGESVDDFARRVGVSRASVFRFLAGSNIRLRTWEKIEDGMRVKSRHTPSGGGKVSSTG